MARRRRRDRVRSGARVTARGALQDGLAARSPAPEREKELAASRACYQKTKALKAKR
jgi:hypothetical protein